MQFINLQKLTSLSLNIATAERLKSLGLFDVMALVVDEQGVALLGELRVDAARFAKVLWEMVDQTNLTFDAFCSFLTAEADELWEAFTREVVDFFPVPIRPTVSVIFAAVETRLATWHAMILKDAETAWSSSGLQSGEPPELPESIPGHSLSGNSLTWLTDVVATNTTDTRT